MKIDAYAKINLFLDIEGVRENGYHNIISVMQAVDWCDRVTVERNSSSSIEVKCSSGDIPHGNDNIAYRAAKAFCDTLGENLGVDIYIEKNIPVSAGMAGGSADAAAVLLGMNSVFGNPFSTDKLLSIAETIGADVPFCLLGGTKIVRGIGEIIENTAELTDCHIVCAKMGEGYSTPVAYRELDAMYDRFENYKFNSEKFNKLQGGLLNSSISDIAEGMYNIFESVVEKDRENVSAMKEIMCKNGAFAAMMSGSGTSVFGLFENNQLADKCCHELASLGAKAKVCKPIKRTKNGV